MNAGRIQQIAGAYELYHRPNSRFVADFIGQGVFVDAEVVSPQRVRFELGEVSSPEPLRHADTGQLCAVGERVQVLMRPDDVLHDDASPLRATVQHKAFRGAEILYTLQLASGARVLALVPSHHNHALHEAIGVRLDMDHVIAFAPQR
jgi:iron(III) transport system ATP-binding protein